VPWLKTEVGHRPPRPRQETVAYRWSRQIQHRPWPFVVIASLVLVVLALPVLSLRLGFQDESNFEDGTDTKEAYDLLAEGFGKGFNGPLLVVAQVPGGGLASLDAVTAALAADPDVASVSGPVANDEAAPTAVLWNVVPRTGPQDEATTDLVKRLRADALPPVEHQVGSEVFVTGAIAGNVDFASLLGDRLPLFFGAVLALSFLLLMVVFRSLLVPLKAVVMNLLSIGAAYGIIVALFQKGWLGGLTGVEPGPIEAWAPMMLFAVVFGLSMDYEVFLLSRVREGWLRTGDTRTAVADGLAATAKVITAAAAIMVVVFGSFLLEDDRVLKMVGVGLATAILLDATIVRMVLVPATMELLGDKNWWLPRWLDRILPRLDVEGHAGSPVGVSDDEDPRERELVGAND
jgi:RND superfamily putative drug exporter